MRKHVGSVAVLALLVAAPAVQAADVTGRAGIGAGGGGMLFTSGDDFSRGSGRPIGQIVVKYNFSPSLAGVLESGWGWNAYANPNPDADDTLAVIVPTTAGLEYRFQFGESQLWPHLGGGLGLYSLGIKPSFRTWAENPETGERLTWTSPGFYLKAGGDYVFDNHAAVFFDFLFHAVFSDESDRFPQAWGNQNTSLVQFRIGGIYYFSLGGSAAVPGGGE